MKRLSFLIALMIALNWSGPVRAETDIMQQCGPDGEIYSGYSFSYNKFMTLNTATKKSFIDFWLMGFLSGLSQKYHFCAVRISVCLDSTTSGQRLTMLEKYASDSPEQWNADHHMILYVYNSFVSPCLTGKIPINKKK